MLVALLLLASTIILGVSVAKKLFDSELLIFSVPFGILFSTWIIFFSSLAVGFSDTALVVASIIALAAAFLLKTKISAKQLLSKQIIPLAVVSVLFFAAANYALFHYDSEGNLAGIPTDFGFHSSIITSIANGNFPPEHQLYAGHPLSYYYFLHLYSASLLKGGFNLQAATYLPAVLLGASFVCLLFLVAGAFFPKKGASLAYLAILLVLLNGTMALSFSDIVYPSALRTSGFPFENILVTILLISRVFTIGLCLFLILLLSFSQKKQRDLFLWAAIGLLPLFHFFSFILIMAFIVTYALLFDRRSAYLRPLSLATILAIPQLFFLSQGRDAISAITLSFGWMSLGQDPLSVAVFWFNNLGIYLILAALAFCLIKDKRVRAIYVSSIPPFIIANIFIFTPYPWDNLKFFIFFFVMTAILAAYGLAEVWRRGALGKCAAVALFAVMTLTGFLSTASMFAQSDSIIYTKADLQTCDWVEKNTAPDALFLTDGGHTCLFATAGRKIFLGFPEWLDNHGINYSAQRAEQLRMLQGDCVLTQSRGIDYVFVKKTGRADAPINRDFFERNATKVYENDAKIYVVGACG